MQAYCCTLRKTQAHTRAFSLKTLRCAHNCFHHSRFSIRTRSRERKTSAKKRSTRSPQQHPIPVHIPQAGARAPSAPSVAFAHATTARIYHESARARFFFVPLYFIIALVVFKCAGTVFFFCCWFIAAARTRSHRSLRRLRFNSFVVYASAFIRLNRYLSDVCAAERVATAPYWTRIFFISHVVAALFKRIFATAAPFLKRTENMRICVLLHLAHTIYNDTLRERARVRLPMTTKRERRWIAKR